MKGLRRWVAKRFGFGNVPLSGHEPTGIETPLLDLLSDADLQRLNELLPWMAYTVDGKGRRFGQAAWKGKRSSPQAIPDRRIIDMHSRFGLTGRSVLEIGCFEGIHTAGLAYCGAQVKAVDARIENVAKTVLRCAMLGHAPLVFQYDVEAPTADPARLKADFAHHVGVLYHLKDPVTHLLGLSSYVSEGLMLDTHYVADADATHEYVAGGASYAYKPYREWGRDEVFSGMYDHSKWLKLDDIVSLLARAGFANVDVAERRQERNGPRALIFACR